MIEELMKNRERYRRMRSEAQEMVANPPATRDREISRAKAKTRIALYGQFLNGLDWLLGNERPWSKAVHESNQRTNTNEQYPREQRGHKGTES